MLSVDHMLHWGFGGGKHSGECWGSAPLQLVMYKGAHAVASDTLKQPALDLERLLATACPFKKIFVASAGGPIRYMQQIHVALTWHS